MGDYFKYPDAPVAYYGWQLITVGVIATVAFMLVSRFVSGGPRAAAAILAVFAFAITVFSLWFFRNPQREPLDRAPGAVISAADGTVLRVERVNDPRYGGEAEKLSIFMSPFNVHINRAPVTGIVEKVEYTPGKFFVASLDKASTDNERNFILMKSDGGHKIGFSQIAGIVARRIVCGLKQGDRIGVGARYGMIRFGSRMEMFMPPGTKMLVGPGESVEAGRTVIARLD
ncbi:MAG: phosphatidylserine decarboxylase [Bdellovibrionales bacterium RIFOXYD1_FULL_53_11]|nr:MAG: phosphatidylserine decarboxylase [Bdellovibrionales bacterium RIFOXYD1_FULL_53_11]